MPSPKATFLVLVSAALSLPSLAQAPAGNPAVAKIAPKPPVAAAKSTRVAPNKAATKVAPGTAKVAQNASAKKKANGKKAPEPQPMVQLPPPPPPTPAQLPPNPARVTMRNGLLTIDANNSTLADVLTGVRRETKAAIDLPPGATGERVVANLGPGTPQTVLTALLNGSRFDYIILGSQEQPDTVQRVILRAKSGPEPTPGAASVVARGPNPGGVNVEPVQPEEGDEQGAPAEEIPDENNPQPQPQEIDGEQQQGQPGQQPQQDSEQQQGQPGQQPQQQPGVKTPEQLLEELRQMQQQQQEQQQQQQGQPQPYQQQPYQQQQPQQPPPDEQ